MGIGIGSILKLAKGGLGPDQLAELLAAVGIDARFSAVEGEQVGAAFIRTSNVAVRPGARVLSIQGKDKDGADLEALLVLAPRHSV
jgi:hypothetical protein